MATGKLHEAKLSVISTVVSAILPKIALAYIHMIAY